MYNRYLQAAEVLPPIMVYPVQLKKVDQHDQGVAGAIFKLEKLNPETNRWETYVDNLMSNAQGFVNSQVGEPGDYRFVETKAPDGFDMADNQLVMFRRSLMEVSEQTITPSTLVRLKTI